MLLDLLTKITMRRGFPKRLSILWPSGSNRVHVEQRRHQRRIGVRLVEMKNIGVNVLRLLNVLAKALLLRMSVPHLITRARSELPPVEFDRPFQK